MPIVTLRASGEAGFLQRLFTTEFSHSLAQKETATLKQKDPLMRGDVFLRTANSCHSRQAICAAENGQFRSFSAKENGDQRMNEGRRNLPCPDI